MPALIKTQTRYGYLTYEFDVYFSNDTSSVSVRYNKDYSAEVLSSNSACGITGNKQSYGKCAVYIANSKITVDTENVAFTGSMTAEDILNGISTDAAFKKIYQSDLTTERTGNAAAGDILVLGGANGICVPANNGVKFGSILGTGYTVDYEKIAGM